MAVSALQASWTTSYTQMASSLRGLLQETTAGSRQRFFKRQLANFILILFFPCGIYFSNFIHIFEAISNLQKSLTYSKYSTRVFFFPESFKSKLPY